VAEAMPALLQSCQHAGTLPPANLWALWPPPVWCPQTTKPAIRTFLERQFQPYAVSNNGRTDGLLTGYFEPEVEGARKVNARMHAPLLARPTDLVEVDLGAFTDDLAGRRIAGRMRTAVSCHKGPRGNRSRRIGQSCAADCLSGEPHPGIA
jgi:membrane-bound lytic murein transglycosylase A